MRQKSEERAKQGKETVFWDGGWLVPPAKRDRWKKLNPQAADLTLPAGNAYHVSGLTQASLYSRIS